MKLRIWPILLSKHQSPVEQTVLYVTKRCFRLEALHRERGLNALRSQSQLRAMVGQQRVHGLGFQCRFHRRFGISPGSPTWPCLTRFLSNPTPEEGPNTASLSRVLSFPNFYYPPYIDIWLHPCAGQFNNEQDLPKHDS